MPYERRRGQRRRYRNGYYTRDFVTRFGIIRRRNRAYPREEFSARGLQRFQRRAEEVSLLIREGFGGAFRRGKWDGWSPRSRGETVGAQTVSKLTRDLDEAVRQFHQTRLSDHYVYLFLDGVSLGVRPAKRVGSLIESKQCL